MSVREEERQKNTCPSRGLGLAAAAIGVGVGAALYYFFSKRPENPDGEGSTTGWNEEEPHALDTTHEGSDSDSYTTISVHSTTDTSIEVDSDDPSIISISDELDDPSINSMSDELDEFGSLNSSQIEMHLNFSVTCDDFSISSEMTVSDSEIGTEWDITDSSEGIPEDVRSPIFWRFYSSSPRQQRNRERSWSLEECSICFDVILKDQQVTTLPCTHHFHSGCIAPWLQEQQTCPNCRKSAE